MTTSPDDDALAWAGDEKHETPTSRVKRVEIMSPAPRSSVPAPLLITYGILAGLYLIYTAGWVITILRSTTTLTDLLAEIMFQLGEFLAIASPAVWFAAVLLLTRGRKPIIRLLLLLAGLVATIPWPFLLGV